MRMSIYAIELVKRYSEDAKEQLERNLAWVKGSVIGEMSQIKEPAAEKCMQELENFDQCVRSVTADLNHISELMTEFKNFYGEMNE